LSRTIDERVVEMRFDNRQFENNVHTSLSTLDKLKEKLNLTGASKGLDEVNKAASKVDMNPLARGVETVGLKFNALQTMADHALRRITDRAMDAGERIVKSLTIDPIKTGFSEYETKINSIQTIMSNTASKGTTMEDVTKVIGELNTYADKTIYNFAEMTRNIGTFTAAGIGLEDSAASIKGIANLAAASGSTSQQASTAMYQLSQAMAAGSVKLMDWNSVVNAGMGGEKFQEALKATAREYGVAVDEIIERNGSFRESLSEGWISTDILNQTLRKFTVEGAKEYADSMVKSGKYTREQADALIKEAQAMEDAATKVKTFTQLMDTLKESAQSGWSQTWEILIGDFEEAKETLTKVSDTLGGIINASAESRNELLSDWKILGGRNDLLDSFVNIFEAIKTIVVPIKDAFRDIFPPMTAERLKEITENIATFTSKLKLSEVASDNLKRTFRGLFAIVNIVKMAFLAVYKILKPIIGLLVKFAGWLLSVTAALGDWVTNLNTSMEIMGIFDRVAQRIIDSVSELWAILREKFVSPSLTFLKKFIASLGEEMSGVGGSASKMKETVVNAFSKIASALEGSAFYQFLKTVWKLLLTIGSFAADVLTKSFANLKENIANADFESILEFIRSISVTAIAVYIANFVKGLKDITKSSKGFIDALKDVVGNFSDVLGELKKTLKAFTSEIKSRALMNIAKAILILVAALVILTFIDQDKLMSAIAAMSILFIELMGAFKLFTKIDDIGSSIGKSALVMLAMSTSVLILAAALEKIAYLNMNELINGLIGIGFLLAGVAIAAKYLSSSSNDAQIVKGAARMIIFAFAVKILAGVVEDLGALDILTLLKGLLGVSVLLMGLSAAIHLMTTSMKDVKFSKAAIGILVLAVSMKIVASACKSFANISWNDLAKGLIGASVLLAGLTIAVKVIASALKESDFSKSATAIIAISAALLVLTFACKSLAKLSWNELAKGLVGVTVLLAGLTASIAIMAKFLKESNLANVAITLLAMAAAIKILTDACIGLSKLSWSGLAKGLIGIGASMAILAVGLRAVKGTEKGSLALLAASVALAALAPTLAFIGHLKISTIAKGLLAMAGAFAILGIAGALLAPLSMVILTLAGAIALVGAGTLLFGLGLSAMSAGIVLLSGALAIGAAGIVAGMKAIIVGLIGIIPDIVRVIGDAIVAVCEAISGSAKSIGKAIVDVLIATIDTIVASASAIVGGLLQLVTIILESLIKYAPQIVGYLIDLILIIVDMLIGKMPSIIGKLAGLVSAFMDALLIAFKEADSDALIKGILAVGLIAILVEKIAKIKVNIKKASINLAKLSVIMLELVALLTVVGLISQIPEVKRLISDGGSFMQALSIAILQSAVVFGAAAVLASVADKLGKIPLGAAAKGIALLSVLLLEIGSIIAVFGIISKIPYVEDFVKSGGPFLASIAAAIGQVIGALVGGLIGGVGIGIVDSLVTMATGLSTMMTELKPFLEGACNIDASALGGIGILALICLELAAAAVLAPAAILGCAALALVVPVIGVLMTALAVMGNLPGVNWVLSEGSSFISKLVEHLKQFASMIPPLLILASFAVIGPLAAVGAAALGLVVAELGVLFTAFGILAQLPGIEWLLSEGVNFIKYIVALLDGFGTMILPLTIIASFAVIGPLAAVGAAALGLVVTELGVLFSAFGILSQLPCIDQLLSDGVEFIKSIVSLLDGFGTMILPLTIIASFAVIGPLAAVGAAALGLVVAELGTLFTAFGVLSNLPCIDGLLSDGVNFVLKIGELMSSFNELIAPLTMIVAFTPIAATAIPGIAALGLVITEMTAMLTIFGALSAIPFIGWVLDKGGEFIVKVGDVIKDFIETASDIKSADCDAAIKAMSSMSQVLNLVPNNVGDLKTFNKEVPKLAESMEDFYDDIEDIDEDAIPTAKSAISTISNISKINASDINSVSKSINEFTKAVKRMAKDINDDLSKSGKEAIEAFIKGIDGKIPTAERSCKTLVSKSAKAISDKKSSFKSAAKDLVKGFAEGISANTYMAEAKARAMAKAAAEAAEDELDINSPSKVLRDIGYSVPEGFALGIDKLTKVVGVSASSMGDTAISGVRSSISRIANLFDGDMDVQPTIRPVLDLSDVRAGAGSISRMFGSGASLGVEANLRAIGSSMNRQNGGNDDVISAIDKLRDDIKNINNNTYTINGITYDDGSNITEAVRSIVRAAKIERRI